MALAGAAGSDKVVVVGPRRGLAGVIAQKLQEKGKGRKVEMVEDASGSAIEGAKVVIVSRDPGNVGEEDELPPADLVHNVVANLPSSVRYLMHIESGNDVRGSTGFLGLGKLEPSLSAVRDVESATQVVVHCGELFGEDAGQPRPLPFVTGPKAEPKLDDSWSRQGVLLGQGTLLTAMQNSKSQRSSVAEVVGRVLEGEERTRNVEFSVVSVESKVPPTEEEWKQELNRLDDTDGVRVLRMDFEAMPKGKEMAQWLVSTWGPNALRSVSITLARSGERPIGVQPVQTAKEGLHVVRLPWESLDSDLSVITTGQLKMELMENGTGSKDPTPQLVVSREDGRGEPLPRPLAGEEELIQILLEGVNSMAYRKGFVKRVGAAALQANQAAAATPSAPVTAVAAAPNPPAVGGKGDDEAVAPPPPAAAAAADAPVRKGRGRRAGSARRRKE